MFDCHIHVETGLESYDTELSGGNIIFNSLDSYTKHKDLYPNYYHSLIFDFNYDIGFYKKLIAENKIICLKIHSRIQKIAEKDYPFLISKLQELDSNIPIIYDAFYYGEDMNYQPNLAELIKMIKIFPNRKFIIGHAGGYEILKYYFHLRTFLNVGYDLSLSLQYLEDSSCLLDFIKLIKFTPKDRLFFGTDYPFASPKKQKEVLEKIFLDLNLTQSEVKGVFLDNYLNFVKFS